MNRQKLIDILSNFTVTDDYLGELVDTSNIDSALREKLVSVIEEVAGDEYVKKYYAQLSAYAHALRTSGVDVTHTLVYYPVQERIVRLH